jgi:4-hydroxy-3-methylbut-2-enyl diphosphate reductase
MKVLRASHYGMCFGVRDAIALAIEQSSSRPLTVLGDLVHNETVLAGLRARGVSIARYAGEARTEDVMVTAHGASEKALAGVRAGGHRLWDATCPLVHKAHQAVVALVRDGYHPVIVGKRDHVEVRGLTEDLAEVDIVLSEDDIRTLRERPRFGVAAQTTQPFARVARLAELLQLRFPASEVKVVDTVCRPTKDRQQAAVELAMNSTVVIVIGGLHSNNTRELVQTCLSHCPRVHHVRTAAELRTEWFTAGDVVGITAGTSTPDRLVDEVEVWLLHLAEPTTGPEGVSAGEGHEPLHPGSPGVATLRAA